MDAPYKGFLYVIVWGQGVYWVRCAPVGIERDSQSRDWRFRNPGGGMRLPPSRIRRSPGAGGGRQVEPHCSTTWRRQLICNTTQKQGMLFLPSLCRATTESPPVSIASSWERRLELDIVFKDPVLAQTASG